MPIWALSLCIHGLLRGREQQEANTVISAISMSGDSSTAHATSTMAHMGSTTASRIGGMSHMHAMAIGMAFMFAPASVDYFDIPTGFWSLAFANGAIGILLWMLVQAFAGRGANMLWLLMAFDLGAMAYMWSPAGFQAPITWLLVAYFTAQAALWATDRMRDFDARTILGGGGVSVTPEGALTASVAEPLICFKDLRASMAVMTLGMAYMFAAMQLVMS